MPTFLTTARNREGISRGTPSWAGALTDITTRSALLTVTPCTVTVAAESLQLSLSSVSTMAFAESAHA